MGEVNLLFVAHLYKDDLAFEQLIRSLRSFYPRVPILAIGDGVPVPQINGIQTFEGERLKHLAGTYWTQRWMQMAIDSGASHIVKFDADARMWRAFQSFPKGDIAGTITYQNRQGLPIVRGGCVFFPIETIRRILDSGFLEDETYKHSRYRYYRYRDFAFPWEERDSTLIHCEDSVLGHVAKRLRLTLSDWDDVRIEWRDPIPSGNFAVTHPVRD
ncbi:hypothetical protein NIES2135_53290 [Leptolyngbya boryana NIES-2135]|uniref:Nucleotide-diphospho-sugar transferase domain-containing protein n=1 Tax=Leptolyngbya boryana NIES-2135 TaxID=1973484 RepID=A0A1Z4JP24_LEPBY|nr:hypothetical protein LBWT_12920 [Leptolyngbya boryana IAM M-101]BAS61734.1 hypothetical protein LBDG_12920 [Leptolyngbya boryana dg5]BAY58456.1 hypothetical protein NIES2135_53290 [Leptolyngbya boryana NIES-2135]